MKVIEESNVEKPRRINFMKTIFLYRPFQKAILVVAILAWSVGCAECGPSSAPRLVNYIRPMVLGRREESCQRLATECATEFKRVPEYVVGDLREPSSPEAVVKAAMNRWGKISILINNCGGPKAGTFESFNDSDWEDAFQATFMCYVRAIRACIPFFRQQKYGRIVNIASGSTKTALTNLVLSNSIRMGIIGLAKTLASELGNDGILINSISPGKIDTNRIKQLDQLRAQSSRLSSEELRKENYREIPLDRYGTATEVATLAAFLCSP
jgi:3-oxoacyl-[acyl-carrier protein] reductase